MLSNMNTSHRAALAAMLAASLLAFGCAGRRAPATPAEPPPEAPASAPEAERPAGTGEAPRPGLRDLCRQGPDETEILDETRQTLEETFCSATLWLDGLLGGEADVENARAVSGRVDLSTLYTEFDGFTLKERLRLRYDLPNLERRLNVFVGRDERDEFVEDRREGFAVRSSVFGLEDEEEWLAGLGYSPPGRWNSKIDFRVGGKLKSAPEVFAQSRYRRNIFAGDRNVWRFRETVFWENREGFGSTTSLDFDHVLRRDLLFRWGNIGTFSESTDGIAWRSAALAYHNIRRSRAVAGGALPARCHPGRGQAQRVRHPRHLPPAGGKTLPVRRAGRRLHLAPRGARSATRRLGDDRLRAGAPVRA